MATEVFIAGTNARAKKRNPWGVLGLTLITLGIYTIFWWYFINRELRDLGRARGVRGLGDNPGLSTAAYALAGFTLYISLIWTVVTTSKRVHAAQRLQGQYGFSGWLALIVWILTLFLGGLVFTQYQLNQVWARESEASPPLPGTPAAGDADLERLGRLKELHASGALSDEEFDAEKARILPPAPRQASSGSPEPGP